MTSIFDDISKPGYIVAGFSLLNLLSNALVASDVVHTLPFGMGVAIAIFAFYGLILLLPTTLILAAKNTIQLRWRRCIFYLMCGAMAIVSLLLLGQTPIGNAT